MRIACALVVDNSWFKFSLFIQCVAYGILLNFSASAHLKWEQQCFSDGVWIGLAKVGINYVSVFLFYFTMNVTTSNFESNWQYIGYLKFMQFINKDLLKQTNLLLDIIICICFLLKIF